MPANLSSSKTIWPNLFLFGVPRAATTAVYMYLQQHPEIYMTPAKEPGFFAVGGELYNLENRHKPGISYFLTTIHEYQALFRFLNGEKVIGDGTPHYLFYESVPRRIAHYCKNAKLMAILRSPADRTHSHYMMELRHRRQRLTFEEFIKAAPGQEPLSPLLHNSFYFEHLAAYYRILKAEQIKIILYDDLKADTTGVMQDVYQWLGVDDNFKPEITGKPNRSGVPKSRIGYRIMMRVLDHRLMRKIHLYGPNMLGYRLETYRNRYFDNNLVPQTLSRERELALNNDIFYNDIQKVQALINRDLSIWLE